MRTEPQRILELQMLEALCGVDVSSAKPLIAAGDDGALDEWLDKTNDQLTARLHSEFAEGATKYKREVEQRSSS